MDLIDIAKIKKNTASLSDIMKHRVNNSNFLSKIASNSTLILTEDINLGTGSFDLRNITNLTIKCETGKATITGSGNYICYILIQVILPLKISYLILLEHQI